MKEKNKIIKIITCMTVSILLLVTISYGFGVEDLTGTQQLTEMQTLRKAGNNVVKVITTVGIVFSVVMLIVLGIKYMIGSTEEKAAYKKSLMPYVIGAGLVLAASTKDHLVYNIAIEL